MLLKKSKKTKQRLLFFTFIALLFSVSFASAQENMLEPVFDTLSRLRLFENYERHPFVADFIVFLVIFIGLSRFLLLERIGSPASSGIGIILALALAFFEYRTDWSIGRNLGPIVVIILMLILGVFIYLLVLSAGSSTAKAGAAAYSITFAIMVGVTPNLMEFARRNAYSQFLFAFLSIVWFIAVVYTFINLVSSIAKGGDGGIVKSLKNFWKGPKEGEVHRHDLPPIKRKDEVIPAITEISNAIDELERQVKGFISATNQPVGPQEDSGSKEIRAQEYIQRVLGCIDLVRQKLSMLNSPLASQLNTQESQELIKLMSRFTEIYNVFVKSVHSQINKEKQGQG
ncbi:MAG: hypothetical protein QXK37_04885 [Candidatus Woesearchaeota archaeon]